MKYILKIKNIIIYIINLANEEMFDTKLEYIFWCFYYTYIIGKLHSCFILTSFHMGIFNCEIEISYTIMNYINIIFYILVLFFLLIMKKKYSFFDVFLVCISRFSIFLFLKLIKISYIFVLILLGIISLLYFICIEKLDEIINPKIKRQYIKKAINKSIYVIIITLSVFSLTYISLDKKVKLKKETTNYQSFTSKSDIYNKYKNELLSIKSDTWEHKSLDEKEDILKSLAKMELIILTGNQNDITINLEYVELDDLQTMGVFYEDEQCIKINSASCHQSDLLFILCHEVYHQYQNIILNTEFINDDYPIKVCQDAKTWKQNEETGYIDGKKNFEEYSQQALEASANDYAMHEIIILDEYISQFKI